MNLADPPEIKTIIKLAELAEKRGDWPQAREILQEGLRAFSDQAPLLMRLGRVLRKQRAYGEAILVLRRAEERAPDDPDTLRQLGLALEQDAHLREALSIYLRLSSKHPENLDGRCLLADAVTTTGRPDKALRELEKLLARRPDRINYRLAHGRALGRMGRYTEALASLEEVLAGQPDLGAAWLQVAEATWGLWRVEAWMEASQRAYHLDPHDPLACLWMGRALEEEGQEAEGMVRRALDIHPRLAQAHVARGRLCWRAGQEEEAQRWLESGARLAPWDGEAVGLLARFLLETGRGEPNLEQLEEEARTLPYGRLPYHLGQIFLDAFGDTDRALAFATLAVECAPEDVHVRRLLADVHISRGAYGEAMEELQRVLDLCPSLASAHNGLAFAALQAGQLDRARQSYAVAAEELPHLASVHHGYGVVLLGLGQTQEAMARLRQAQALAPQDGEILFSLAQALAVAGLSDEAREVARRARGLLPEEHKAADELWRRLGEI